MNTFSAIIGVHIHIIVTFRKDLSSMKVTQAKPLNQFQRYILLTIGIMINTRTTRIVNAMISHALPLMKSLIIETPSAMSEHSDI